MADTGSGSRRPSGSRVGSSAAVEALRTLTCLVTATLGDAHAQQLAVGQQAQAELSAEQALDALQKLAVEQQHPQAYLAEDKACGRSLAVSQHCERPGCLLSCFTTTAITLCASPTAILPSMCEKQSDAMLISQDGLTQIPPVMCKSSRGRC